MGQEPLVFSQWSLLELRVGLIQPTLTWNLLVAKNFFELMILLSLPPMF